MLYAFSLESCEPRRHFASTAVFNNGILLINGTAGNDRITIINFNGLHGETLPADAPPRIVVKDGQTILGYFHTRAIQGVEVHLGAGNDSFTAMQWTPDPRNTLVLKNTAIAGDDGNDIITWDLPGYAQLLGGRGNDTLRGGAGNDTLRGGVGDDVLSGGAGTDSERGDDGNDTIMAGNAPDGADWIGGGNGIDTLDYSERTQPIAVTYQPLTTGSTAYAKLRLNGRLQLDGRTGKSDPAKSYRMPDITGLYGDGGMEKDIITPDIENVNGSRKDDVIVGNGLNNVIHGNAGNDWIVGGSGNDTLYGDAGDDTLFSADTRDGQPIVGPSNFGFDRVVGGAGRDLARTDGRDTVLQMDREDQLDFLTS